MDTRIPYRERYIRKAERLFGKSREYICFSDNTYKEFVEFIHNLKGIPKKNRLINKMRDYRKGIKYVYIIRLSKINFKALVKSSLTVYTFGNK